MKNFVQKYSKLFGNFSTAPPYSSDVRYGPALLGTDVQCQNRLAKYKQMLDDRESDGRKCDDKFKQREEKSNEKKSGKKRLFKQTRKN